MLKLGVPPSFIFNGVDKDISFKSKSIFKIGVVCEPGEIVFGEKKTNQDSLR